MNHHANPKSKRWQLGTPALMSFLAHGPLGSFFFSFSPVHLRDIDPGETKKEGKNRMISGQKYITLDHN